MIADPPSFNDSGHETYKEELLDNNKIIFNRELGTPMGYVTAVMEDLLNPYEWPTHHSMLKL